MTNVKIQMTNQIQMIKCLNDSIKIQTNGRDFFAVCRDTGPFTESALPTESYFPHGKTKSVQFGDSAPKSLWGFIIVQSTRYSGFLTSSR